MLKEKEINAINKFAQSKLTSLELEFVEVMFESGVEYSFDDDSWQDVLVRFKADCGHEEIITLISLDTLSPASDVSRLCLACFENREAIDKEPKIWDAYPSDNPGWDDDCWDYGQHWTGYGEATASVDMAEELTKTNIAVAEHDEGESKLKVSKMFKLLKMDQNEVANYMYQFLLGAGYKLEDIEWVEGGYIWAKGDRQTNVMLMGHMDTVRNESNDMNLTFNKETGIIKNLGGTGTGDVLGGDDRCAMFLIQEVIIQSGIKPDVLLTYFEESGGIGIGKFCKEHTAEDLAHIHWTIEPDKSFEGGRDLVWCRYDDDCDKFESFLTTNYPDMKEIWGSYTDMCDIQVKFGINGINIDACYNNQHTKNEYIDFYRMPRVIDRMIEMMKFETTEQFKYVDGWSYNSYYSKYSGYASTGSGSWINQKVQESCIVCGWECEDHELAIIGDQKICYDCCEDLTSQDIEYLLYGQAYMDKMYGGYDTLCYYDETKSKEDLPFEPDEVYYGKCQVCKCEMNQDNVFKEYNSICLTCAGLNDEVEDIDPQKDVRCYCVECGQPIYKYEEVHYMSEDTCKRCIERALAV